MDVTNTMSAQFVGSLLIIGNNGICFYVLAMA